MANEPPNKIFKANPTGFARNSRRDEPSERMDVDYNSFRGGPLDIINHQFLQVHTKHVIEVRRQMNVVGDEARRECKVLKFASEYNLPEVLTILPQISPKEFRKLFVVIIEAGNFGLLAGISAQLLEIISKMTEIFCSLFPTRPFIIQLTSIDENFSRFIYKNQNSIVFNEISLSGNIDYFTTFFQKFMNGEIDNFNELLADQILSEQESTVIIRFLKIYDQLDGFFHILRIKCVENGTKDQFLAALDDPFDNDGRILSNEGQRLLTNSTRYHRLSSNIPSSFLSIAVRHSNVEVFDYLVNSCAHLIQQLPQDHQKSVTSNAYCNQKYDFLCDLLEIADFPFPCDFDKTSVANLRLQQIVANRENFDIAILNENTEGIKSFIGNNRNLKIVYNFDNKSALQQAIDVNKINIYCLLKSYGFQSAQNENLENVFNDHQKAGITKWNAENSVPNEMKSIMLLTVRSFIYNRKISKETETEYCEKIKEWYEGIYRTQFGPQLLNVVAQCEDLKIIYDFDCELVNDIDLTSRYALGTTHLNTKWIFIGAKRENREAIIKGTIAHELCHYALLLIFENSARPYYLRSKKIAECFDLIVKYYARWFPAGSIFGINEVDDRCDRVISAVYKKYHTSLHHQELIVRVPHILAQFDGNSDKINELRSIYEILFTFYEIFMVPAMKSFNLKERDRVRKFNRLLGELPKIRKRQISLSAPVSLNEALSYQNSIISTNVPPILLQNIQNNLFLQSGMLLDTQAIFTAPKALKTKEILKDLEKILEKNASLEKLDQNSEDLLKKFCELIENFVDRSTQSIDHSVNSLSESLSNSSIIMESSNGNSNLLDGTSEDMVDISVSRIGEFKRSVANLIKNSEQNGGSSIRFTENHPIIPNFNVIVDCTKESGENFVLFTEVMKIQNINFTFVVLNGNQRVLNILEQNLGIQRKIHIDYSWNDLNTQSQRILLQNEVNFQNSSKIGLKKLILSELNQQIFENRYSVMQEPATNPSDCQKLATCIQRPQIPTIRNPNPQIKTTSSSILQEPTASTSIPLETTTNYSSSISAQQNHDTILKNCEEIIDSQLLNLLIEKSEILVNSSIHHEFNDVKNFKIIFQSRNFIKKYFKEERKTLTTEEYEALKDVRKFTKVEKSKAKNSQSDEDVETIKVTEIVTVVIPIKINDQLSEVKNKRFVLISDIAGTGKSWMLRNIANILHSRYPDRWLTYVDLKQFIDAFKSHVGDFNFVNFMVEKIVKTKAKFEQKIFKKLYENGKVFILFDGFDEISPDCAEKVTNLLESFKFNGGNQLWITTRDYFEVDLQGKLEIDVVYKLDEFTEKYGIDLISLSWIMKDLRDSNVEIDSFDEIINNHQQNFEKFKQIATNLLQKIPKIDHRKIGFPQFYKMIAEIYEDKKDGEIILTMYQTYKKFGYKQFDMWAYKKGKLRKNVSIKIHMDGKKSFNELHQFHAMENLFPGIATFCDLTKELIGWLEGDIIGCGLMSKKVDDQSSTFVFIHETFCEFYAAEFVLRILRDGLWEIKEDFFTFFINLLTSKKFDVVRMFINDGFTENLIFSKIEPKIEKFAEKFHSIVSETEQFHTIFAESLENLVTFSISILKNLDYTKVNDILLYNIGNIIDESKDSTIYSSLQNFFVERLKADDLKKLIEDCKIFHRFALSSLNSEFAIDLIDKIEGKVGTNFIQQSLKTEKNGCNLLAAIAITRDFDSDKFTKFFEILQKYLNSQEVWDMICNWNLNLQRTNILHLTMLRNDEKILKTVWTEIEKFSSKMLEDPFRQLLNPKFSFRRRTPLHDTSFCDDVKFHKTLWELLMKTFKNREELKNYILLKDNNSNNFIHSLVSFREAEIIELIFKILKENFSETQYLETLTSKGFRKRNLLQKAVDQSHDVDVHKTLWNIVQKSCESDEEFLKFHKYIDDCQCSVFDIAVAFSTHHVLDFMADEIKNFGSNEEIKEILRQKNKWRQNLIHSSLNHNKSLAVHQSLWRIIKTYFGVDEVMQFIWEPEKYGCNIIHYAVTYSSIEIANFTWNEIKNVMSEEKCKDYLNTLGYRGKELKGSARQNKRSSEMTAWVEHLADQYK